MANGALSIPSRDSMIRWNKTDKCCLRSVVEVNKEKSKGNDVTSTSLNHNSRTKGSYDSQACMHSFQVGSMRTRRPHAPHHTCLTIAPVLKLKTIATSRIRNPQFPQGSSLQHTSHLPVHAVSNQAQAR